MIDFSNVFEWNSFDPEISIITNTIDKTIGTAKGDINFVPLEICFVDILLKVLPIRLPTAYSAVATIIVIQKSHALKLIGISKKKKLKNR